MELVSHVKEIDAQLPIVVMTAWGNIDLAVEAMRRGAGDFIQKPWENARLLSVLQDADGAAPQPEASAMAGGRESHTPCAGRSGLYCVGANHATVLEMMARVGPSDANVLITGEHGTGKEVVAQTLHRLSVARRTHTGGGQYRRACPKGHSRARLFGHVKGAFTDARTDRIGRFELANGGTCFWMRLRTFQCVSRRSCCAYWRRARWSAWARPRRRKWMCG